MDEKDILITKLLSAAIRGNEFKYDTGSPPDWKLVYREALAHQIHTLIYPVVSREAVDKGLLSTWGNTTLIMGLRMSEEREWIEKAIKALMDSKIQVIALKGIYLNTLYPHPELRIMGDADLLIHTGDMAKACEVLQGLGYISDNDQYSKHVVLHNKEHLTIELHKELVEYDFLKNKSQFNKDVWENLNEVRLLEENVNVLSLEMQVIHLCVHMAAHIIYEGFGLRQLCDLVLLTEKKYQEIDWSIVLKRSKIYGVEKFVFALYSVCNRLFHMKMPEIFMKGKYQDDIYVEKLITDIFMGGAFGLKDEQRISANTLLKNVDDNYQFTKKNKLLRIIDILFPAYNKISSRTKYSYVKKNHVLLPVAWIHRLIYGVRRKDFNWKSKKSIFYDDKVTELAQQRNELLQWLGLK